MIRGRTRGVVRRVGRWAVPLLAAGALGVLARPAARTGAVPERVPVIRQVDGVRDAADLRRIEEWRGKLPGRNRRRHNFAWARASIEGLDKTEYFAHSGIQRLGDFPAEVRRELDGISVRPRKGRFEVLCVNHDDEVNGPNGFFRNSDTERKILEDLALRLPDPGVSGGVRLYTDLYPCASCRHIMRQFLEVYTNVYLLVLYREH